MISNEVKEMKKCVKFGRVFMPNGLIGVANYFFFKNTH